MARSILLPALGMPKHMLFCPQPLVFIGIGVAIFMAFVASLLFPSALELMLMIFYALWHLFWAIQYQRNPWIFPTITERVAINVIPLFSNKSLFKENGWAWYA